MNFFEQLAQSGRLEVAIAGIIGSAVHVAMEWEDIPSGLRRGFVGGSTAFFMSPVGIPLFEKAFSALDLSPERASGFGGFVTGVAGVIIIEILLNTAKSLRGKKGSDNNGKS